MSERKAEFHYDQNYGTTSPFPSMPPPNQSMAYPQGAHIQSYNLGTTYYSLGTAPPYGQSSYRETPFMPQNIISSDESEKPKILFTDESMRRAFVRKVYTILMFQLLLTGGLVALFSFYEPVKVWVRRHSVFYFLSYATFLVTYLVLVCCASVRRRYPGNFIALAVLTLAMAYVTGTIAAFHNVWSVCIALGISSAVCLGVTVFAIFTKIDFTKLQAYLLFFGLAFVFFGFACMIVFIVSGRNRILQAVYGGIGALVFSLYLCYDTQMIIGGKRYQLSEEEYITGAVELYMDVVQIFLMILMGVSSRD